MCPELQYTLNRLVRGVASSRVAARKGFYATLVGLLSAFSFLTVEDVLAALKKELHSANSSKSVRCLLFLHDKVFMKLIYACAQRCLP